MKVGVLSEFIPSKKNKPKCLLAATDFEKVYTSFFFYSRSAKPAFLITTTKKSPHRFLGNNWVSNFTRFPLQKMPATFYWCHELVLRLS